MSGIEETRNPERQRHLPARAAFGWLAAGWRDLMVRPGLSFRLWACGLRRFRCLYLDDVRSWLGLHPVSGPRRLHDRRADLAVGLYKKSRAIEDGERPTLGRMLRVKPRAGAQIFFTGVLLCLLMLLWMRAAALCAVLRCTAVSGLDHIVDAFHDAGGPRHAFRRNARRRAVRRLRLRDQRLSVPSCSTSARRADGDGNQHGHGLEQSRTDDLWGAVVLPFSR